jgi:hypothetical protein
MLAIKASHLDEVEEVGAEILPSRADKISNGRIGGRHWFLAVVSEAKAIMRRKSTWESRRG